MTSQGSELSDQKHDRNFLLSPEKRNELVELWEVEKYGRDCFGDPDHVRLYGMAPKEWWGGVCAYWIAFGFSRNLAELVAPQ
jgi:hypothetical protein